MAKRERGDNPKRFSSTLNALTTSTAQQLVLKPLMWQAINIHVHGTENLHDAQEPFIVIANHSSHFDGPLLMSHLPWRISRRLATGVAADTFFTKWQNAMAIQLFMNAFPVNRGSTRSHRGMAKQLLSEGVPLMLFPEGTRSRTGAMGPFTPGVAALAISFNCQVLPCALVGTHAAWPPREKRYRPGRPDVHVVFGLPMRPRAGEIAYEFNERMRRRTIELHDTTALAYGMPTQAEIAQVAAIGTGRAPAKPDDSAHSGDSAHPDGPRPGDR